MQFLEHKNSKINYEEEVKVETGITGKDGLIEITQGLQEGDEVITFITNNKR